jgi:hypothetical protein
MSVKITIIGTISAVKSLTANRTKNFTIFPLNSFFALTVHALTRKMCFILLIISNI